MDFSQRLQASFAQVFGELIPALLGALIIVFAGYLLARPCNLARTLPIGRCRCDNSAFSD